MSQKFSPAHRTAAHRSVNRPRNPNYALATDSAIRGPSLYCLSEHRRRPRIVRGTAAHRLRLNVFRGSVVRPVLSLIREDRLAVELNRNPPVVRYNDPCLDIDCFSVLIVCLSVGRQITSMPRIAGKVA